MSSIFMTFYSCKRTKNRYIVDFETDKMVSIIKTRIGVFETFKIDTI